MVLQILHKYSHKRRVLFCSALETSTKAVDVTEKILEFLNARTSSGKTSVVCVVTVHLQC